jgi:hypothetical protein
LAEEVAMKRLGDFLAAMAISTVLMSPVLAQSGRTSPTAISPRAAPGPVLGAGLPVLAIGYGVFWLVRRRKKATGSEG